MDKIDYLSLDRNMFIIGNGFDRAHELEITYHNFITFTKNKIEEESTSNKKYAVNIENSKVHIKYFSQKDFELWSDLEEELSLLYDDVNKILLNSSASETSEIALLFLEGIKIKNNHEKYSYNEIRAKNIDKWI